jgi:predicted Na+-dependent transporter
MCGQVLHVLLPGVEMQQLLAVRKNIVFLVWMLIAISAGLLWPDEALRLGAYRHYLLITVMFLVGLEQNAVDLVQEVLKAGQVSTSILLSYVLFPLIAWSIAMLFFDSGDMLVGFVVLGAVPVTMASAVIYTKMDRGNYRLALLIVFLSQLIGVIVTPFIIYVFLSRSMSLDVNNIMFHLMVYFLLPLSFGMLAANFLHLGKIKSNLSRPQQFIIATFVFIGVGHIPRSLSMAMLGQVLLAVLIIQMLDVVIVRWVVKRFEPADQTALFFTSTQKTLPAGLYLVLTYFSPVAILPLVLYHILQLAIGRAYWIPPNLLTKTALPPHSA